jgi:hypothetical protein
MTIGQVRNFYDAQPFRPFAILLADGHSIPVMGRESNMASAPSRRTTAVDQPDDTLNVIDRPLVTDLEVEPPANHGGKRPKRDS